MSKQAFKGQYDDEEVLFAFRKHPVVMRRGLIYFMLAILLGTVPSFIKPELSYFYAGIGGGFLLGIFVALPSWVNWYFSVYIVTDQRFIQSTQKGFFNKKVVDLALSQIQMINYEIRGIQETLLGFGTITVQTFVGNLTIHDVHKPAHIQHELLHILRDRGYASNVSGQSPQEIINTGSNSQETQDD
jgi:hypothetical protein